MFVAVILQFTSRDAETGHFAARMAKLWKNRLIAWRIRKEQIVTGYKF